MKKIKKTETRETACQRGYDAYWRSYRLSFLRRNPLCVECKKSGKLKAASVVDHIIPHRGNKELFWDIKNHQALCTRHHNEKTRRGE